MENLVETIKCDQCHSDIVAANGYINVTVIIKQVTSSLDFCNKTCCGNYFEANCSIPAEAGE